MKTTQKVDHELFWNFKKGQTLSHSFYYYSEVFDQQCMTVEYPERGLLSQYYLIYHLYKIL